MNLESAFSAELVQLDRKAEYWTLDEQRTTEIVIQSYTNQFTNYWEGEQLLELSDSLHKMAVSATKSALSVGQRVWNALSAWCIRNAGYQKYGKGKVYVSFVVTWHVSTYMCCKTGRLYWGFWKQPGIQGSDEDPLANHC